MDYTTFVYESKASVKEQCKKVENNWSIFFKEKSISETQFAVGLF